MYFEVSAFPQKQFITSDYVVLSALAVVALLLLVFAFFQFKQRRTENPDVALDIKEGKKHRIVAPVDGKDMIFVSRNGYVIAQSQSTTPRANDATLIDLSSYENKIDIDDRSAFEGKT